MGTRFGKLHTFPINDKYFQTFFFFMERRYGPPVQCAGKFFVIDRHPNRIDAFGKAEAIGNCQIHSRISDGFSSSFSFDVACGKRYFHSLYPRERMVYEIVSDRTNILSRSGTINANGAYIFDLRVFPNPRDC